MCWETINDNLYRVRVPFGWLVRWCDDMWEDLGRGHGIECGYNWRNSITFVFDPFHVWKEVTK